MAEHPFDGGRIPCIYRSNKKDQYILQRTKRKKKTGMESHRKALDVMKQNKSKHHKQLDKGKWEVVYSQIAQNMEKMRNVVRSSLSQASTISAEE